MTNIDYDFEIPAKTLEKFKRLYAKDKDENLVERAEFFVEQNEDHFWKYFGAAEKMYQSGWAVIPIRGSDFAYSYGATYTFGIPEVMVIGAELDFKQYNRLINEILCFARDKEKIVLGKDYTHINHIHPLEISTNPEDVDLPDGEKRVVAELSKKSEAMVPLKKPLIFSEYTPEIRSEFACGYLERFYANFADTNDIQMIVADLRL